MGTPEGVQTCTSTYKVTEIYSHESTERAVVARLQNPGVGFALASYIENIVYWYCDIVTLCHGVCDNYTNARSALTCAPVCLPLEPLMLPVLGCRPMYAWAVMCVVATTSLISYPRLQWLGLAHPSRAAEEQEKGNRE